MEDFKTLMIKVKTLKESIDILSPYLEELNKEMEDIYKTKNFDQQTIDDIQFIMKEIGLHLEDLLVQYRDGQKTPQLNMAFIDVMSIDPSQMITTSIH